MVKNHNLILFDLGGVLIDLKGVPKMMEWTGGKLSVRHLWERWVSSPSVIEFESGIISLDQFSDRLIYEFHLPVSKSEFIQEFKVWAENLFPGVPEFLGRLTENYSLATLSNTNSLHWDWFKHESGVYDLFSYHFPSHVTGLVKPNEEIFYHVLEELPFASDKILFLDDNEQNVISAIHCGLHAACVNGFEDVMNVFSDLPAF